MGHSPAKRGKGQPRWGPAFRGDAGSGCEGMDGRVDEAQITHGVLHKGVFFKKEEIPRRTGGDVRNEKIEMADQLAAVLRDVQLGNGNRRKLCRGRQRGAAAPELKSLTQFLFGQQDHSFHSRVGLLGPSLGPRQAPLG